MKPNETVFITTKARIRELEDLDRNAKKVAQLSLPVIVKDHLTDEMRTTGGLLSDHQKSRQVRVGSAEIAKMCGTKTAAQTRAFREGRIPGGEKGANGRWSTTLENAEKYAAGVQPLKLAA